MYNEDVYMGKSLFKNWLLNILVVLAHRQLLKNENTVIKKL